MAPRIRTEVHKPGSGRRRGVRGGLSPGAVFALTPGQLALGFPGRGFPLRSRFLGRGRLFVTRLLSGELRLQTVRSFTQGRIVGLQRFPFRSERFVFEFDLSLVLAFRGGFLG